MVHHHTLRAFSRMLLLLGLPLFAARCATYSVTEDEIDADAFAPQVDASSARDSGRDSGSTAVDGAATNLDASTADAARDASAADADAGSSVQGACAMGQKEVGQYGTWGGKVNVHKPTGGVWSVDSDCSSGAGINTVVYCQKFWPNTAVQVHLPMVTPELKPFTRGGGTAPACGGIEPLAGIDQFVCCAPAP